MPVDVLRIQGAGYIDVCAIDGDWQAVYRQGADVVCIRDGLQRWFVGIDILQIRCACDDAGKVLAVGQHHVTGQLTLVHEGRVVEGDWGHAGGFNSCAVAFDGLRWHTWQMDTGKSYIHRVFQRDTLAQLFFDRVDISILFPGDPTSQGILYIENGQPVFYDLNPFLRDSQGRIVLQKPNPVTPFLALQEDTGDRLWIGQGGRGLAAFDAETNILQTVAEVHAEEPHIARLSQDTFVACCRTLTDAVVVVFDIPLVADVETDLPVHDPGRPFAIGLFHHHYRRELHPSWGTLVLNCNLDVVSDPIPPVRPSLIGPDAIAHAPNDKHLVQGLFLSMEDGGPELVEREIVRRRELWTAHHPGADIPPVVVYLTEAQRITYGSQWATATSADIWAPELYYDEHKVPRFEDLELELQAWTNALGRQRPWLLVCQAYDRNVHQAHMATVARLLPANLNLANLLSQCRGLLFFDCNRSGLAIYPEVQRQYERIVAVCTPPAQLHPWTPIATPAPPRVAVRADKTRVKEKEDVTCTVDLLPGSGPVHAGVDWYLDEIGDGGPPLWFDSTAEFTNTFDFTRGQYRISAKVSGPGGEDSSDESDSPLITVEPAEEPEMPELPNEHDYQNFLVQLHAQGYQKYLMRPRGIFTDGGPITDPTRHGVDADGNRSTIGLDEIAVAQWGFASFTNYFMRAPANARPTRLDWAMRHTIRDIKNHPDAPADSPPLPEEWNESFDVPPLLPSSR